MGGRQADLLALGVAKILRLEPCAHGLPECVVSMFALDPWGPGATCKPLCDACVMDAVRRVIGEDQPFDLSRWEDDGGAVHAQEVRHG